MVHREEQKSDWHWENERYRNEDECGQVFGEEQRWDWSSWKEIWDQGSVFSPLFYFLSWKVLEACFSNVISGSRWGPVRNTVSGFTLDLLDQSFHFNKIPSWFVCTLKFKKHCSSGGTFDARPIDIFLLWQGPLSGTSICDFYTAHSTRDSLCAFIKCLPVFTGIDWEGSTGHMLGCCNLPPKCLNAYS